MRLKRILLNTLNALGSVASQPAVDDAETIYRKGMDAFLQGDYDQVILWSARSLQADPTYKKSQDLLSVLVVEKEKGVQTEIWLGDRPRPVQPVESTLDKDLTDIRGELLGLNKRVGALEKRPSARAFEQRFQMALSMLQKNSDDNYRELRTAQGHSLEKLERITRWQSTLGQSLFWLFVLVAISLVLSVWNIIRKKPVAPRMNVERPE